jgi:hypothetical protein
MNTEIKSLLFLDVDGVLNPWMSKTEADSNWTVITLKEHTYMNVWISWMVFGWLEDLIEHGTQIVWATTWVDTPDRLKEYIRHLGFSFHPYEAIHLKTADYFDVPGNCGKLPGIIEWLQQHPQYKDLPKAWIDDELGVDDKLWAAANNVYALKTDPAKGLHKIEQMITVTEHLIYDNE